MVRHFHKIYRPITCCLVYVVQNLSKIDSAENLLEWIFSLPGREGLGAWIQINVHDGMA